MVKLVTVCSFLTFHSIKTIDFSLFWQIKGDFFAILALGAFSQFPIAGTENAKAFSFLVRLSSFLF